MEERRTEETQDGTDPVPDQFELKLGDWKL